MSTDSHYHHYYVNADLRRRAAFTAIMAHRRRRTITAVNIHAKATGIADQQSNAPDVPSKEEAPPKAAEYLLFIFLSREDREAIRGDLEEEYRTVVVPKFGPRSANVWYWWHVFRSIWPVISGALGRLVSWLIERFSS